MKILVKEENELSEDEKKEVIRFITLCFGKWDKEKRKLENFSSTFHHLFLYEDDILVSYLRFLLRKTKFDERGILICGIGDVSTHPDYRGKGYGTELVGRGMQLLKEAGCDIGLLQTDTRKGAQLYKTSGFIEANKSYTFHDVKGRLKNQLKQAVMIAPINNQKLFEEILESKKRLYIGKGDW